MKIVTYWKKIHSGFKLGIRYLKIPLDFPFDGDFIDVGAGMAIN